VKSGAVGEERDTTQDTKGVDRVGKGGEKEGEKKKDERTCARVLKRFWVWMWDE
jgi:hypothetical protein